MDQQHLLLATINFLKVGKMDIFIQIFDYYYLHVQSKL